MTGTNLAPDKVHSYEDFFIRGCVEHPDISILKSMQDAIAAVAAPQPI